MSFWKEITKPISGLLGGVGSGLNKVTGQTSAGKMNQKYAKELAAINQQYALEAGAKNQEYALQSAAQQQQYARANMALQNQYEVTAAKNAHQWEIQDLQRAGLNPILSAGGQGAQADAGLINASVGSGSSGSGSAGAGSQGASGIDIFNSVTSAGQAVNQMKKLAAETRLTEDTTPTTIELQKSQANKNNAEASEITAKLPFVKDKIKSEIINNNANASLNSAKTTSERGKTENVAGSIRNYAEENAGKGHETHNESWSTQGKGNYKGFGRHKQ